MTIKEFSKLCNCTTQTLRYYDHINLLKPVRVDDMTGYRYYSEEQALLYVKIKNFQEADFTIEEIKSLLYKSEEELYAAFERKIAEHEMKLDKIRQIQQSYRSEINNMKRTIQQFIEKMNEDAVRYDPTEEFGIDRAYYETMLGSFSDMLNDASYVKEAYVNEDEISPLQNQAYVVAAEYHNWHCVKEIGDNFAGLEENTEYNFYLEVDAKKERNLIFAYIIMQLVRDKNEGRNIITPSCNITTSTDNKNHLYILKKKPEA